LPELAERKSRNQHVYQFGITPAIAATAAVPYAQNAKDLLNLLPGRSVLVTFTAG
jgi:hypothetical protein